VRVLVASQVLGGVGVAGGIAVGALLAEQVSGSTALSGLAQTATVLGAALLAVPLARLAGRSGRQVALATGYGCGLLGAVLAVVAAVTGAFWLLLVGTLLFGGGTAANLQARYAATDDAPATSRARSLSVVVWATTVGAVAGPNLSGLGGRVGDAVGIPSLAGPYLFSVLSFGTAGLVVLVLLRHRRVAGEAPAPSRVPGVSTATALRAVAAEPRARLGLAAIACAHAVMTGVMAMTPVHMGGGGASLQVVGIVISAHVAGMYAASPVMGWLTDRAGRVPAIGVGLGLLLVALLLGAAGGPSDHALLGVALAVLGLGWSCCLVAGSTLVSESVPETVRTSVQGASDLTMGIAGASAGAIAGPVLAVAGYAVLTFSASLLIVPVAVLALLVGRTVRPSTA
jgi:MFS family permease